MKRINPSRWLRTGIALAVLSLVGLATLSGVGSAQTQGVPTNTSEPRITGAAVVGSALTVTNGTWTESPTSFDYQWTRCPASGARPMRRTAPRSVAPRPRNTCSAGPMPASGSASG